MINYDHIADAVSFYKRMGYEEIDAPWLISKEAMLVTAPPHARLFDTFAGSLVASGEQSFIEIRKSLKKGKYLCVTPCFRDELKPDAMHLMYFMKVELIFVNPDSIQHCLSDMIANALAFFSYYLPCEIWETDIGYDIASNNIELGSYGYREHDGFLWVYGTGCAEPRLSQVINSPMLLL